MSNLALGDHPLGVRYRGYYGVLCTCNWITNTIHVVQLLVQSAHITPDQRLEFDVLTSLPGRETVVQGSSNLADWFPISTNVPGTNRFTFTDDSAATNDHRFYRVRVE